MQDIAIAFRSHMIQQDAIIAVFGDRVHIDDIPQNAVYPCVRIQVISDYPKRSLSGTGLGKALMQLNVVDPSRVVVGESGEVLRSVYDGFTGQIGEFKTRVAVVNVTSDWIENAKVYIRMVEVDVGYVREK
jgi:hypothetical protein